MCKIKKPKIAIYLIQTPNNLTNEIDNWIFQQKNIFTSSLPATDLFAHCP